MIEISEGTQDSLGRRSTAATDTIVILDFATLDIGILAQSTALGLREIRLDTRLVLTFTVMSNIHLSTTPIQLDWRMS